MEFIHNYKKDLDMVRDVEIVENILQPSGSPPDGCRQHSELPRLLTKRQKNHIFTKGVLSVRRTLKLKIRRLEH